MLETDPFSRPSNRSVLRGRRAARRQWRLDRKWLAGVASTCSIIGIYFAREALPDPAEVADRLSLQAGLQLVRIEIRGHRHASEGEVRAALGVDLGTPLFRIDLAAAGHRIAQLPWIKVAAVHRVLPDGLLLDLTERTPAAVWRLPGRSMLIDAGGHILADIGQGADVGLPVLSGDGADRSATAILTALTAHPALAARTLEARHIAARRWALVLDTGTLVHLPGDGIDAALEWLGSNKAVGLLDAGLETIDLRVAGSLVVRPGAGATKRTALATPPPARE